MVAADITFSAVQAEYAQHHLTAAMSPFSSATEPLVELVVKGILPRASGLPLVDDWDCLRVRFWECFSCRNQCTFAAVKWCMLTLSCAFAGYDGCLGRPVRNGPVCNAVFAYVCQLVQCWHARCPRHQGSSVSVRRAFSLIQAVPTFGGKCLCLHCSSCVSLFVIAALLSLPSCSCRECDDRVACL